MKYIFLILIDKEISRKLVDDAMFKLEHSVADQDKKRVAGPEIIKLENLQERWKDDYALNQQLRKKFRVSTNFIT